MKIPDFGQAGIDYGVHSHNKPNEVPASNPGKPTMMPTHYGPAGRAKLEKVGHEFKTGMLHSGSKHGPLVTNRKQMIAIALSEANKAENKKNRKKSS